MPTRAAIALYRSLLRLAASPVLSPLAQTYVHDTVRTRFALGRVLLSPTQITAALAEARRAQRKLHAAVVAGDAAQLQRIHDAATGQRGRLRHVLRHLQRPGPGGIGEQPRLANDTRSKRVRRALRRQQPAPLPMPTELLASPRFGTRYVDADGARRVALPRLQPAHWGGLTTWRDAAGAPVVGRWAERPGAHEVTIGMNLRFYRVRGRRQSARLGAAIRRHVERVQRRATPQQGAVR